MLKSDTIGKLTEALSKAQGEIKGAVKDSNNPFFKASYADLSSVWDACREQLTKNGLAVIQTTDTAENGVIVETILSHTSGEWIGGRLHMNPTKNDPQGVGSAITYARRYALAAIVGVCPEDDDGEGAMGRETKKMDKKSGTPSSPATPQEAPVSSQESPALLSFSALLDKVLTSKNEFELKGRWTKYAGSIKALDTQSPQSLKALNDAKDKQKELFKVCTKDTATCHKTISDGKEIGCQITMRNCLHYKEAK